MVLLAIGGSRYSVRLVERARQRRRGRAANMVRVAIIGAGDAGAMIVKEMQANPQLGLEPVIFLDDDERKHWTRIHGVPIVGGRDRIPDAAQNYRVEQAIIAIPTASGRAIRELMRLCRESNLAVKTVPGIFELLDGSVTVNQLRPVDIETHPHLAHKTVVADIRDEARLRTVFERERPQVVFHAAAHKHVPLMEENIEDAVTNNVLGTRNVVNIAAASGVEYFVLISTDKAVNPTSVMGVTKRVAELVVQETAKQTGRPFVAVRFGNVLGSRGSVVPVFKQQIARGGPVTVTHPEVQRYFMPALSFSTSRIVTPALACGASVSRSGFP